MNLSNKLPLTLMVLLIGISLFGFFEQPALTFVSGVFEKNLKFLELTSEVQMVISGLGSIKLPIIEGVAKEARSGLSKVIEYLLITDIISFCQVMLLSISKSWLLKSATLLLFALTFLPKVKAICTKLLILSLSLSPGLAIYSLGVQSLAKESSIDFGQKYLTKLEAQVTAIKSEKAKLMEQHRSDLAKINNGQKGIHILQKFREDISYDFKRAKNDIRGAHAHIRLFLHDAGHEMKSKIYGFCSMIVFCMLILPLGYVLIIYMLISSLFNINSTHLGALVKASSPTTVEKSEPFQLRKKLKRVFNVYLEEFHNIKKKAETSSVGEMALQEVETAAHEIKTKVEDRDQTIDQTSSTIQTSAGPSEAPIDSEGIKEKTSSQSKVVEAKAKKRDNPSTLSI